MHLRASKVGAAILTRNTRDFDILNQIVPSGAAISCRQEEGA